MTVFTITEDFPKSEIEFDQRFWLVAGLLKVFQTVSTPGAAHLQLTVNVYRSGSNNTLTISTP